MTKQRNPRNSNEVLGTTVYSRGIPDSSRGGNTEENKDEGTKTSAEIAFAKLSSDDQGRFEAALAQTSLPSDVLKKMTPDGKNGYEREEVERFLGILNRFGQASTVEEKKKIGNELKRGF